MTTSSRGGRRPNAGRPRVPERRTTASYYILEEIKRAIEEETFKRHCAPGVFVEEILRAWLDDG